MDNLDNLLAGSDGSGDRGAGGFLLNVFDEAARNRQGDVRLKQGDANFTHGGADVIFGQGALFGEAVKDAGQAF